MSSLIDKKEISYSRILRISKLDFKERLPYFDEVFSEASLYYGFLKSMDIFFELKKSTIKIIDDSYNRLNIISLKNNDERAIYTDEAISLFMLIYGLIEGIFFFKQNNFFKNNQCSFNIELK